MAAGRAALDRTTNRFTPSGPDVSARAAGSGPGRGAAGTPAMGATITGTARSRRSKPFGIVASSPARSVTSYHVEPNGLAAAKENPMFSHSDGYERFMGRWSRRLAPLLVKFAGVNPGDVVLDVGCGTGALPLAAGTTPSAQLTGVDPSATYVEYAKAHSHSRRVCFEVGDAQALQRPDSS